MAIESRTPQSDADGVSRRSVIRTAAVAGAVAVAGVGLAACGGGDSGSGSDGSGGNGTTAPGSDTPAATGNGGGTGAIANTADIPVGGGVIVKAGGQPVVVTQPKQGDFKAFSAICTHQGCTVNKVQNGTIICPCHNSQYSAEDGSVTGGPAPQPLPKVNVKVEGTGIVPA
jgi:Rieske Fe-S protein